MTGVDIIRELTKLLKPIADRNRKRALERVKLAGRRDSWELMIRNKDGISLIFSDTHAEIQLRIVSQAFRKGHVALETLGLMFMHNPKSIDFLMEAVGLPYNYELLSWFGRLRFRIYTMFGDYRMIGWFALRFNDQLRVAGWGYNSTPRYI